MHTPLPPSPPRSRTSASRVTPGFVAVLVTLLLGSAAVIIPQFVGAGGYYENGFTTSVDTNLRVATPDSSIGIHTSVRADERTRGALQVLIQGPAGQVVAEHTWPKNRFRGGKAQMFSWSWQVPADAAAGTYTVQVGIYHLAGGARRHFNQSAKQFRVDIPTNITVTTPPPTTVTTTPTTTVTTPSTSVPPMSCDGGQEVVPLGAVAPTMSMLCHDLGPGVDTALRGSNMWIDDFDSGVMMSELPGSYVSGTVGTGGVSRHFAHKDHWMADIRSDSGQYPTLLASWMRPDTTFRPRADGSVVIEFEVATPMAGTRNVDGISDSWPEFAISTAPAPTGMNPWYSEFLRNGTYFYESFAKAEVMGCRMQQSEHPICAYYGAGSEGAGAPDRLWEINQNGTDVVPGSEFGGDPAVAGLDDAWAECSRIGDPDTMCRNTFRVTLTADTIRIDVKKPGGSFVRYYEATPCNDRQGCSTGQMGRIINNPGGFYVFFAGFAYRIEDGQVLRFHWDRLAVNPPS